MYLVVGPQLAAVRSGGPHTEIFTLALPIFTDFLVLQERININSETNNLCAFQLQLATDCHLTFNM